MFWNCLFVPVQFINRHAVVQLLSCVWLFVTPRTAECQASLSFTISQSLLKFMSVDMMMPSCRWCYLSISSSAALFTFCLQSLNRYTWEQFEHNLNFVFSDICLWERENCIQLNWAAWKYTCPQVKLLLNTSLCVWHTMRPNNTQTYWSLEQTKVYCQAVQGDEWLMTKSPELLKGFQQSIFKGKVREGRGWLWESFVLAAVR